MNWDSCVEALSQHSRGISCSSRIRLAVNAGASAQAAILSVATAHQACAPLARLGCTPDHLATRRICDSAQRNSFREVSPTVELGFGRAGSSLIRPLFLCAGASVEVGKCEGNKEIMFTENETARHLCLKRQMPFMVKAHPYHYMASMIGWLEMTAAALGGRSIRGARAKPSIIVLVRNPLDIVHSWCEGAFGRDANLQMVRTAIAEGRNAQRVCDKVYHNGIDYASRILRSTFSEVMNHTVGKEVVAGVARHYAKAHVREWETMARFMDDRYYSTLLIYGEDLRDPRTQPSVIMSGMRHIGLPVNRSAALRSMQAMALDIVPSVKGKKQAMRLKGEGTLGVGEGRPRWSPTANIWVNASMFWSADVSNSTAGTPLVCRVLTVRGFVRACRGQGYAESVRDALTRCPNSTED